MSSDESTPPTAVRRVLVVGATGYIGQHATRELVRLGHAVTCVVRRRAGVGGRMDEAAIRRALAGAELRFGDVTDPASLAAAGIEQPRYDAVVSCLASRTGGAKDSWRIEHQANLDVLQAATRAGAEHFVLLSAICVQKPRLEFQRAKLAFERALIDSGLRYSIVRPTAFFKSLSGQVEGVKNGKPFVMFGDGELTACKPISERDLARLLADCLDDPDKHDAILPVGGPGPAITPRQQGELLFSLLGRPPRFRKVPLRLFDAIVATLGAVSKVVPPLRDKAELARIGRYYGTESMLVWDEAAGRYDADATPSFGQDTLEEFYARVLREGLAGQELGDQAVF
ncbi:MAG: NAD(P)H-binding protein [Nannocystaceae bacterium]